MKDRCPKLAQNLRIDKKTDMKKWQKSKENPLPICKKSQSKGI